MMTKPARAGLLLALAALPAYPAQAAKPPPPPTGELLLDMADPVIRVTIGTVLLRLRVGLEAKRLIELNPDAAARLTASPPHQGVPLLAGRRCGCRPGDA